jgi:cytoskeletal protein RodZ
VRRLARQTLQSVPEAAVSAESIGSFLKRHREQKGMSVAEISRDTRIPLKSIHAIEADQFDNLPGEVFTRGFLKSYAVAVGILPAEVLASYDAKRRAFFMTPLPIQAPLRATAEAGGQRFGVAIAFVLMLILFTLALSFVLKPRGRDMPTELSQNTAASVSIKA